MDINGKILVVDDEKIVRESLKGWFEEDGYVVDVAASGKAALSMLSTNSYDVFLLDIKMPEMNGLELQSKIREFFPNAAIIIMTAYASVDSAVEALKNGAYDYITKPFDPEDLGKLIKNAVERKYLLTENVQLRKKIDEISGTTEIIGESRGINDVLEQIALVSQTDSTVLIRGESGTGKELVARAIHASSSRKYMPIITVNCSALSESLLESELFGHEKGAFTGAQYRRKGKFEMADGGTIFLDEVGDISPKVQMEFLRVIEDKKITRLGGSKEIDVNFRVIAATNRNLEQAVEDGSFRQDLYYRFKVFTIDIPPIRERVEDIPLLAMHFVKQFSRKMNKNLTSVSPEAMAVLKSYEWPGNVRELENALERAVLVCQSSEIRPEHLPFAKADRKDIPAIYSLSTMEKQHIENVLNETGWNISLSSRLLQIDRVTLYNKIKKYKLKK